MTTTTISSRIFNQDVGKAKRAALNGPVLITDRGHFAHVLMTFEEYQRIIGEQQSIADALAMPEAADIEFEPAKLKNPFFRPEDFT